VADPLEQAPPHRSNNVKFGSSATKCVCKKGTSKTRERCGPAPLGGLERG